MTALYRVPWSGLRLMIPALIPSWRFFDGVVASPRLDYAVLSSFDAAAHWHAFRPRPAVVRPRTMLRRLLWNAQWNEDLYLVSLAERLVTTGDPATEAHSARELMLRVARHLDRNDLCPPGAWVQIRLRFVQRDRGADRVVEEVGYISGPCAMSELTAR